MLGSQIHRPLRRLLRLLGISSRKEKPRLDQVEVAVIGRLGDLLIEAGKGLGRLFLHEVKVEQPLQRPDGIGIALKGLFVEFLRLRVLFLGQAQPRQVGVTHRALRCDLDSLLQIFFRARHVLSSHARRGAQGVAIR